MKNSRKTIPLFVCILLYQVAFSQTGIIRSKLDIRDKKDLTAINQAFISTILDGDCRAFKDKHFSIPDTLEKISGTIKKYRLAKRDVWAIYSIIQWDVRKQEGIILGYTPVYTIYLDTTFFFIPADIHTRLDSNTSGYLKESSKNAILKSISSRSLKSITKNRTIREVKFSAFSDIHQYPLRHLPAYLGRNCLEGILTFHADAELTLPLTLEETLSISPGRYPRNPLNIKKIYLYESWTLTKIPNPDKKENNFLPGTVYSLQKTTKAIGLKVAPKIILWADFKEVDFISDSDKKSEGDIKFDMYKIYFESSFCEKVRMEMILK